MKTILRHTKLMLMITALCTLLSMPTPGVATTSLNQINVNDYGALGDGTDQTLTIQAAINASAALLQAYGSSMGACPVVYFPPGKYYINTSLLLKSKYQVLKGDQACILPTSSFPASTAAILYSTPYRNKITGFIFSGFPYAIELGSASYDVNEGINEISSCQFQSITDTAIRYGHRSSILKIDSCLFSNCPHAVRIWNCDQAQMHGSWISAPCYTQNQDSAFLLEGGRFLAEDSMFILNAAPSGQECSWFSVKAVQYNTYDTLTIDKCRLSGEKGGLSLVNWFIPGRVTYPAAPHGLIIRDSIVESGNANLTATNCLVRLFECPNFIMIQNNYGLLGVATMQWGSGVTGSSKVWTDYVNAPLTVDVAGNCGGGDTNLGLDVNYVLPEFSGKANLR